MKTPDSAGPAAKSDTSLAVLVVDDNQINRMVARQMVLQSGHSVIEAANGEEAIAFARSRAFDLIMMDISMPGIDGIEATQSILSTPGASSQAKIVAVTAHAFPAEIERFKRAGMQEVLTKPISLEAVASLLDTTMTERKAALSQQPLRAIPPLSIRRQARRWAACLETLPLVHPPRANAH